MEDGDFSLELQPSYTDGLSVLVKRFGVNDKPRVGLSTWDRYYNERYLRESVLAHVGDGLIDVWPDYLGARLLTLRIGQGMTREEAEETIGRLQMELRDLAAVEKVEVQFGGELQEDTECGNRVLKVIGMPHPWVGRIRGRIRNRASSLGFEVARLKEDIEMVHIVLAGHYSDRVSKPAGQFSRTFTVNFDKVGIRWRFKYGKGSSKPLGSVFSINIGPAPFFTPKDQHYNAIFAEGDFPALLGPSASRPVRRTAGDGPDRLSEPVHMELDPDMPLPSNPSNEELAESLSRQEARRAALPRNAEAVARVVRDLISSEVSLLKVDRDPKGYHTAIDNHLDLMHCRQELRRHGKEFKLEFGAKCVLRPIEYDAAVQAAETKGIRLTGQHLLVSSHYRAIVERIISDLPRRLGGLQKVEAVCSLAVADSSSASRAVVASSTEARRGGRNHRARGPPKM